MADFNERTIRGAERAVDTIQPGSAEPWMVWTAAITIAALAIFGLVSGIRGGHPAVGVALALTQGEALNPATVAAATPAAGLPKDQQWSTLSGPEVITPSAAPAKSAAASAKDSDEDSSEPAAASAADQADQGDDTAAPLSATPPPTPSPAPKAPPSEPADNSTPF